MTEIKRYNAPRGVTLCESAGGELYLASEADAVNSELRSRLEAADEWANGVTMALEKRDADIAALRLQLAERDSVLRECRELLHRVTALSVRKIGALYSHTLHIGHRINAMLSSAEPIKCPACEGWGSIGTGIDESPSMLCSRCEGTGKLPAKGGDEEVSP